MGVLECEGLNVYNDTAMSIPDKPTVDFTVMTDDDV